MGENDQACSRAQAAAQEVVLEACEDVGGEMVEVAPDVYVFIPEDRADEFDFSLNSPETDAEVEAAIEDCMDSEWARDWAESMAGADAPESTLEDLRRTACTGLFDGV